MMSLGGGELKRNREAIQIRPSAQFRDGGGRTAQEVDGVRQRSVLVRPLQFLVLFALLTPVLSLDLTIVREPGDRNNFHFVRIRYHGFAMGSWGGMRDRVPPWMHDYPRAERNLLKIVSELTKVQTTPEAFLVLDLDDPRIMEFPLLYVSEPGYWDITQEEAVNLREYLLRGGFVIFDDFRGMAEWENFSSAMKRVFPDRSLIELSVDHPVFQCFYEIQSLDMIPPYAVPGKPTFYGMFDENGRLQVVANLNNDIGDYWEWADDSLVPVELSNEAFRFGINYLIYAMTH